MFTGIIESLGEVVSANPHVKNSINPNFIDYGLGVTPLFIASKINITHL